MATYVVMDADDEGVPLEHLMDRFQSRIRAIGCDGLEEAQRVAWERATRAPQKIFRLKEIAYYRKRTS